MSIGVHVLTLEPATGPPIDISCLAVQVAIHQGRQDTDSQPEAASATVDITLDSATEVIPLELDVGTILRAATTVDGGTFTRFVGKITDVVLGWEDAGEDTPEAVTMQVIATGALADLGRRVVGDAPWPQQLDGARVAAVMAAAGIILDPGTSDPGTVQVNPRDVDSQPALEVAQATATDAGGIVWATRDGEVRYADADHRRNAVPVLALDACDVLVTPQWTRTTEGLVNKVSIGYGVAPEAGDGGEGGGEQPRFIATRDDSIARFGRYEFTTGTELAELADAEAMGNLLLTRNAAPVWLMSDLPVSVADLSAAATTALLGLELGSLVSVTGFPAAGTAPTSAALWVEGWTETLAWGVHEVTLVVSGYCRTVPPPRWNDLAPTLTWDTAPGTWDSAACIGPQPNLGRWDDVPATTRWDQIPAAVTWDTYH